MKTLPLSEDEAVSIFRMCARLEQEGLLEDRAFSLMKRIVENWPEKVEAHLGPYGTYATWAGEYIPSYLEKEMYLNAKEESNED
jgi:hypothetical protein